MANIVQRITLQGAEEIRNQLRALGLAGKDAFDKLSEARRVNEGLQQADKFIAQLSGQLKSFGTAAQQAGQAGVAFGNAVGSALTRLTVIAGGLGLAFGKVVSSLKSVGAEAEELQQNADSAGLARKEYEALTLALGQNGIGAEQAGKALDKASKFIREAKDQTDDFRKKSQKLLDQYRQGKIGTREYQEQLKDLRDGMGEAAKIAERYNVRLTEQDGNLRNVREFLLDFGDGLKRVGDATLTTADAMTVFGRKGGQIGVVAAQGREELEKLEARAQALAPSLTDAAQQAVLGMDDAFDQFEQTGKSLKREIVAIFAPSVTALVTGFTEAIARNRFLFTDLAEKIDRELRPALINLLLQMESTDFSVTIKNAIDAVVSGVRAVRNAIQTVIIPALRGIKTFADQIAATINSIFGTQLTGGAVIAAVAIGKLTGLFTVLTTGISFTLASVNLLIKALPILGTAFQILFAIIRANPFAALGFAIGFLIVTILQRFPQIKDFIVNLFNAIVQSGTALFTGLVNFFTTTVQNIINIWTAIKTFFADLWAAALTNAQSNWAAVVATVQGAYDGIIGIWNAVVQFFTDLWAQTVAVFDSAWSLIKTGAQALWDFITSSVQKPFDTIKSVVEDMWRFVTDKFNQLISTVKEFLGLQAQAGSGGGGGDGAQRNAGGGMIRGRGTGTSDSILSWLSNGEFVVKARAVQHYGPQLLNALNNMQLPGFARGGPVSLAGVAQSLFVPQIPRFAAGGPVTAGAGATGGRPMVLQIGDQVLTGLTATPAAVSQMQRYAAQQSVRSAGRKPLWFRG